MSPRSSTPTSITDRLWIREALRNLAHEGGAAWVQQNKQQERPVCILGAENRQHCFFWRPANPSHTDDDLASNGRQRLLAWRALTQHGARLYFDAWLLHTLTLLDGSLLMISAFPSAMHTPADN